MTLLLDGKSTDSSQVVLKYLSNFAMSVQQPKCSNQNFIEIPFHPSQNGMKETKKKTNKYW
jgi:hypothetical protein